VEPFIFALFSKVGSGLPHEQKQVRIIAPQECIVKNDDYKPMEAFIFSLFLIHAANCPDSPLGIKRKMRFLHQPVFSRIDRGKNTEFSDSARKKETNLAEICHKCHPNRFDNPPFLSIFLSFGDL
jgi:hypothetical protein